MHAPSYLTVRETLQGKYYWSSSEIKGQSLTGKFTQKSAAGTGPTSLFALSLLVHHSLWDPFT